jgi:hypothetical protein
MFYWDLGIWCRRCLEGVPMGTTLSHSIIYETAEARDVWREMPSLEMLRRLSLFSALVLSPSVLGYDSTWPTN